MLMWCLPTGDEPGVLYGITGILPHCYQAHISNSPYARSDLGMGLDIDLFAADVMPWSDHFAPKVWLSVLASSCLGNEWIYAPLWRLIDPLSKKLWAVYKYLPFTVLSS